ncbi:DNA repair and recombination protein RadB [Candidatus Woesearchaeota archaeon CG06_land_8_20_14_3_00_33_13]|nr:MAG: DNA repair and recombination protein RadB [Candidatus Woesearchaeota archaeon CG10_big_fil_rev_8_21_14_0_10_33_12]PIU72242.1 MAG: DNA repair and recombination protein RadB [Candidatus Woesearchaeota archaeon CG06_land_8_20_14_3_00_33_13]
MEEKISSGSEIIDKLLDGGYNKVVTTIYGPAASGKTTLAMLAAIVQAKQGKKSVFVDTENGFSVERLKQLSGEDFERALQNIMIFSIKTFTEQQEKMEKIRLLVGTGKISLVIVDTIGSKYRVKLNEDAYKANKSIDTQLRTLTEIARRGIPVILTEQVYDNLANGQINLVGGEMLKNWSKCLIELEKINSKRKAIVKKPEEIKGNQEFFEIKEKGIFKKS